MIAWHSFLEKNLAEFFDEVRVKTNQDFTKSLVVFHYSNISYYRCGRIFKYHESAVVRHMFNNNQNRLSIIRTCMLWRQIFCDTDSGWLCYKAIQVPIIKQNKFQTKQNKASRNITVSATRAVASLSLPGEQHKNISSIFPHFCVVSLIFPQIFFIFFLILVFQVGGTHPGRFWLLHCLPPMQMYHTFLVRAVS